ncbi:MAG: type II secretion system protein [Rhodoferax sp.]
MSRRTIGRGFTLIELLVSVTIVSLLASVAVPMMELTVKRGKERDLRESLREMRNAIDAYKQATDDGRIKKDALSAGYPPDLRILVEGAADLRSPGKGGRIYFLRRIPRDPFAAQTLDAAASWGKRSSASAPDAPAEGDDVFDVYSQSNETGLNGSRYQTW